MIICTCGPCKTRGRKGMYFMKHFLLARTVTLTRPLNDYMDLDNTRNRVRFCAHCGLHRGIDEYTEYYAM